MIILICFQETFFFEMLKDELKKIINFLKKLKKPNSNQHVKLATYLLCQDNPIQNNK